MEKMQAFQVLKPHGPLEFVEKELPLPGPRQVRIKIKACGVCHGDSVTVDGLFPGLSYPRIPGHEIAGIIDAVGPDVTEWKLNQRVGIGWSGGHCGTCLSCRKGDFATCQKPTIPGVTYDGGYATHMIASVDGLVVIPDDFSFVDAGPLMCAGVTTYNSLRNSGAQPGDLVAILGIGGLGHLAVQFAVKMGFKTVAIARGKEKEGLAKELGAWRYINSETENVSEELQKLGGAAVILSTVTNSKAVSAALGGLAVNGKLMILGASGEPIQISSIPMIQNRLSIIGWPSGTAVDSEDTLSFCKMADIRSTNEVFPFEKTPEAYAHMINGKARFRVVIVME
jgi:D-arabinose 1-dehydrogenase-like Zn-dependent alcohol dehydrogenase